MKKFMNPEIEIIKFQVEDVITASPEDTFDGDNSGEWT